MTSKVCITIPHDEGTTEFENFMDSLGEMNRDNHFEYKIEVCKECDDCGAINDTVQKTELGKGKKKNLCDYCLSLNTLNAEEV